MATAAEPEVRPALAAQRPCCPARPTSQSRSWAPVGPLGPAPEETPRERVCPRASLMPDHCPGSPVDPTHRISIGQTSFRPSSRAGGSVTAPSPRPAHPIRTPFRLLGRLMDFLDSVTSHELTRSQFFRYPVTAAP